MWEVGTWVSDNIFCIWLYILNVIIEYLKTKEMTFSLLLCIENILINYIILNLCTVSKYHTYYNNNFIT